MAGCQKSEPELLDAPGGDGRPIPQVIPFAETDPVASSEDAADDAVIIASSDGDNGWIAAADKKFGLRIYDLTGNETFSLYVGRLNNIDAVSIGRDTFLLAASNRSTRKIDLFRATIGDGKLDIARAAAITLDLDDAYGLCMARLDDHINVFVGDSSGTVERWLLDDALDATRSDRFDFGSRTEGCVVDVSGPVLYVGEENRGIWSLDIKSGEKVLLDRVGKGQLTADVEGLDIYYGARRYLVASSQGDNSFAVYLLPDGKPVGRFRIGPNTSLNVDGVTDADGVAIFSGAIGPHSTGLVVVQDGRNLVPPANQNFKLVDWRSISALLQQDQT